MSRKFLKPSLLVLLSVIICAILLGGGLILPAKIASAETIVTFSDPNLDAAIREALDIPSPQPLYESDVLKLYSFSASDCGIIDLSGLEYCINLQYLDLSNNQISDISALQNHTNLQELYLQNNQISSVAPLSANTGLGTGDTIDLRYNLLDISPGSPAMLDIGILISRGAAVTYEPQISLVTFPDAKLEALIREAIDKPSGDIYNNDLIFLTLLDGNWRDIIDLTGLEHCPNLQDLYLRNNLISNISPLQNLTNLHDLNLGANPLSDISPLQNLTNLHILGLWSTTISDYSPLQNLTNLHDLYLNNNLINDINFLQNLTSLQFLDLRNNKISDISPLQNLTGLSYLNLADNQINDISPLQNLSNLGLLWLSNNQISDISPLQNLTGLQILYMYNNQVSDISALKKLVNLWDADLSVNQITDISSLVSNSGLQAGDLININYNYLDITPGSQTMLDIQTLISRGVHVTYSLQKEFHKWSLLPPLGNTDSITLLLNETQMLVYQKAASSVTFSTGTWILKLKTDTDWKASCEVLVGEYNAATGGFIPFDTTLTDPYENGYLTITLDQNSSGTIDPGDYLGFQITNNDSVSHEIILAGSSYVIPPEGSPDFPIPEIPTGVLLGLGLAGLAAFILVIKRRAQAVRQTTTG
jgi:internalin A